MPAVNRNEEINVIARTLDDMVRLDRLPAGQCISMFNRKGVETDLDQAPVQLIH
jgi:hypothetical protein